MNVYKFKSMSEGLLRLRDQPEELKKRVFRLFHTLLHNFEMHLNLYYLLLVLELAQLLNYSCHSSFGTLWGWTASDYTRTFLAYTDLSPLWKNSGPEALIAFCILTLTANVGITALVLYQVKKSTSDGVNLCNIKILSFYFVIFRTVLVLPMTLAYFCCFSANLYAVTPSQKFFLLPLSLLGVVVLLFNCSLITLLFRDNSPFSSLPFASSLNWLEEYRLALKLVLAVYGSAASEGSVGALTLGAVYLGALLVGVYQVFTRQTLIRYPFNRIYELNFVLPLWTLLAVLSQKLVSPAEGGGFMLWVVGLGLVPVGWCKLQSRRQFKLMTSQSQHQSVVQFIRYAYGMSWAIQHRDDPNHLILLEGVLTLHLQQCIRPVELCSCSSVRDKLLHRSQEPSHEDQKEEQELWFDFLRNEVVEMCDKTGDKELWLLLAYIENEVFANKFKALYMLQEATRKDDGVGLHMLTYHYSSQIELLILLDDKTNSERKAVDVNRFFKFQMGLSRLQDSIEKAVQEQTKMWEVLLSPTVSRCLLFSHGCRVNRNLQSVQQEYQQLAALNPNNIQCMVLYSNFMRVIANCEDAYLRVQEGLGRIKRSLERAVGEVDIDKEKYGDNAISAVVIISGEKKDVGVIKHCNSKIKDLCGHIPHKLLGQNVSILMPKFIGNMHDYSVRNYMESSRSQSTYVERVIPVVNFENYMFLARILMKPVPNLLNGIEIVGIFNAILQASPSHPHEIPKYLLYREDTREVQGLSESFCSQFHYRLNKIDQRHESTSQLTFQSVFVNLDEKELKEGRRVRCGALRRNINASSFQSLNIEVFQRLHLVYFDVNLVLLCFYTSPPLTETETMRQIVKRPQEEGSSQVSRQHREKRATREKFLHETAKKNVDLLGPPWTWKMLRVWGITFVAALISIIISFYYVHSQQQYMEDYVSLSLNNAEVVGDICELTFFSRLKQVSLFYPQQVPPYGTIIANMDQEVKNLQQSQLAVDKSYLSYGNFDSLWVKMYSIGGQQQQIGFETLKLNTANYNFITVSSSLAASPLFFYNFSLQVLTAVDPPPGAIMMFVTRYTALFQLLPGEAKFIPYFTYLFQQIIYHKSKDARTHHAIALIAFFLTLLGCVLLALAVVRTFNRTLNLFGHITRQELQTEVDNCKHFLDVFYGDSYASTLQRRQEEFNSPIQEEFQHPRPGNPLSHSRLSNPHLSNQVSNQLSSSHLSNAPLMPSLNLSQADLDDPFQSVSRANLSRIECMEKQLHSRTQLEIPMDELEGGEEGDLLRGEEGDLLRELNKDKEECGLKVGVLYFWILVGAWVYQMNEYYTFFNYDNDIRDHIQHLQLTLATTNSLKLVKLYALETYVDNSTFLAYPAPGTTLASLADQLYLSHRQLNEVITQDYPDLFQQFYSNICSSAALSQLASSQHLKLAVPSDFTSAECSSLLNKSFTEGLQLATVAFTESLLALAATNISQANFTTTNLLEIMAAQKYLETPLRDLAYKQIDEIETLMTARKQWLLICAVLFGGISLVVFLVGWICSIKILSDRLKLARSILGIIPVRVFMRNAKFTRAYEQELGDLII